MISQEMQKVSRQPQQHAAPAPDKGAAGLTEDSLQATPEEQRAYEGVVLAAMEVMFSDKTYPALVKMLKSDEPPRSLAQASAFVLKVLEDEARGQIPETVILDALSEILGNMVEIARTEKLFEVNEATIGRAAQELVLMVGDEYGVDPEQLDGLIAGLDGQKLQQIAQQQASFNQQSQQQPSAEPTSNAQPKGGT